MRPILLAAVLAGLAAPAAADTLWLRENDAARQARAALTEADVQGAILWGERALAGDPRAKTAASAHNSLCIAYRLAERWEAAQDHCTAAVASRPSDWRPYVNRGALQLETGALRAALADFRRAEELAPNEPAVQHNLDLVRRQLASQ